ncbi:MAG: hypothetical protein JSS99_10875 [Actinobacteria bacterium]|nr:hypothetical protein [Actinomycetota bacterium]
MLFDLERRMIASTIVSWRACASSLVALLTAAGMASCAGVTRDAAIRRVSSRSNPRMLAHLPLIQRDHFALLRGRADGLPPPVRRLVLARGAAIDPAMARRIPAIVPGSFWLVPGIGHLCIVSRVAGVPGVGTVCASTRQVIEQGLATISFTSAGATSAPTRLLVGITPDDAREAVVHTHGSGAAVPVVNDVFVLRDSVLAPSDFIALRRTRGG